MELRHIATREGQLSSFLVGELQMSAGLMNKLKWGDAIRVNGTPQHTNYLLKPGDVITVRLDEPMPDYPAEDGPLAVVYEDDHILAVDKPAGMLIHPSRSRNTGTLANFVLGYYQISNQACAFHPITRLDRDTFGIVLLAKNAHAHSAMQQTAFRKTYHAMVFGGPAENSGIIDAPIARRPLPSLLRYVGPEGKHSVTEFALLERYDGCAKLALTPITGRTHQLRVHCAYMGCPILGDPQYFSDASAAFSGSLPYQQLCAKRLEFTHPITGKFLCLESKMDVSTDTK